LETDAELLFSILSEISVVKNNMWNPDTYASKNPRIPFAKIYHAYQRKMKNRGALDYDDMLTMTYELLMERSDVLAFWQAKFRYIMVDEFQDINVLQYKIIQMLAKPRDNLFIVGDDDQSIYRFRGAEPRIMLNFPRDYPKTKKVYLNINYRSGKDIVKESLYLIQNNRKRYEKKLQANKTEKGTVLVGNYKNEMDEADDISLKIQELHQMGRAFEQIAVLFRTNSSAGTILQSFSKEKIPFYAKEHIENVFQNFYAQGILAYLNWLMGCRTRRNFLKMMNAPNRYIRREDLQEEEVHLSDLKNTYERNEKRKWMVEKIEWFEYQMNLLARLGAPYAMINYIRKGIGYDEYVRESAEARKMDPEVSLAILDEVQASSRAYSTIADWYQHIVDYSKSLKEQKEEGEKDTKGKVYVSSLHGSKGLEFEEVFIVDVNEKIMPHERANSEDDLEEERRIFYVGMTRAKEKLDLYSVKERFGKKMEPSRFLREI